MKKAICTMIAGLFLMVGCSDPKNTVIPPDMSKISSSIKKLNDEEKGLLAAFTIRTKMSEAFGGNKMPDGITIGKAIQLQREWIIEQKALEEQNKKKEAEAKALKDKIEKEKENMRKRLDEVATVTVLKVETVGESYMAKQIIKIGIKNKSQWIVSGIKGTIKFYDVFDKEVAQVYIKYDEDIKAGDYATWTGGRNYLEIDKNQKAIAQLKEGKYKAVFEPDAIVFGDGTKWTIPE